MEQGQSPIDDPVILSKMNDGRDIILRTLRPDDANLIKTAISDLSPTSRYFRFFSPAPMVPDSVLKKLVEVDGITHIAWAAICTDCDVETVIGAVRAVRSDPDAAMAEYSITVLDAYHGLGVARMLTAALLVDCLKSGIIHLDAHLLSENRAASALIKSMGALHRESSAGVSDYGLNVQSALNSLRRDQDVPGVNLVLQQLEGG